MACDLATDPGENEEEYQSYLLHERAIFGQIVMEYGGFTLENAHRAAMKQYPYQKPGPHRGLVFHDPPWHWAMLLLYGPEYWHDRPNLWPPPPQYSFDIR